MERVRVTVTKSDQGVVRRWIDLYSLYRALGYHKAYNSYASTVISDGVEGDDYTKTKGIKKGHEDYDSTHTSDHLVNVEYFRLVTIKKKRKTEKKSKVLSLCDKVRTHDHSGVFYYKFEGKSAVCDDSSYTKNLSKPPEDLADPATVAKLGASSDKDRKRLLHIKKMVSHIKHTGQQMSDVADELMEELDQVVETVRKLKDDHEAEQISMESYRRDKDSDLRKEFNDVIGEYVFDRFPEKDWPKHMRKLKNQAYQLLGKVKYGDSYYVLNAYNAAHRVNDSVIKLDVIEEKGLLSDLVECAKQLCE